MSKTLDFTLDPAKKAPIQANSTSAATFWGVTFLSVILSHLPLLTWLFAPVNLFTTAVHEMGHALVCVATGGAVNGLTIVSDGSGHGGLTFCLGGMPFFYTQAGYLGAAFFGCVLIYLSQFPKVSKILLGCLGLAMGFATIFFVPGALWVPGHFLQGLGSLVCAALMSAALLWSSVKLKPATANLLVLFLAVQTALNSLTLIGDLVSISLGLVPYGGFSDATNMTSLTGIPAAFWSICWGLVSLAMVAFTLWGTYGKRLIPAK
jgi:Peptidase M50B-like